MSGPKVVRILTQKEMENIKNRVLRQTQARIEKIKAYATQRDLLDDAQLNALDKRYLLLMAMDPSQHRQMTEQLPAQLEFLDKEWQRLQSLASNKIKNKRKLTQHWQSRLQSLRTMYEGNQLEVPSAIGELEKYLRNEKIEKTAVIEQKLSNMFTAFVQLKSAGNEQARDDAYAQRLGQGLQGQDVKAWLSHQAPPPPPQQTALENLHCQLLASPMSTANKQALLERIATIELEAPSQQRDLRMDSLCIEASALLQELRKRDAALSDYLILKQEAEELGMANLATLDENSSLADISALNKEVQASIDRALAEQAQEAKRQALTSALNKLGYHIAAQPETASVENGRLVISRSPGADYGVELASSATMERLQWRVVSSQDREHRSPTADRNAEETWCTDFANLREQLGEMGVSLDLEQHFAVGELALKQVDFNSDRWQSSGQEKAKQKER